MRVKRDEVKDVLMVRGSNRETERRRGRSKGTELIEGSRVEGLTKGDLESAFLSSLHLEIMGFMAQLISRQIFMKRDSWPKPYHDRFFFFKMQSPDDVSKQYNVIG